MDIQDIDKMPAGRETDVLIATIIMGYDLCTGDEAIALTSAAFPERPGWETFYINDWHIREKPIPDTGLKLLPHYSTDVAAALDLIRRLDELHAAWFEILGPRGWLVYCHCSYGTYSGEAEAIQLAICRAALKAMKGVNDE